MINVMVQLQSQDYDAWRKGFDENQEFRKTAGCLRERLYQSADDPNTVTVMFRWKNRKRAEEFFASDELKQVMQSHGVMGAPTVSYMNRVE